MTERSDAIPGVGDDGFQPSPNANLPNEDRMSPTTDCRMQSLHFPLCMAERSDAILALAMMASSLHRILIYQMRTGCPPLPTAGCNRYVSREILSNSLKVLVLYDFSIYAIIVGVKVWLMLHVAATCEARVCHFLSKHIRRINQCVICLLY